MLQGLAVSGYFISLAGALVALEVSLVFSCVVVNHGGSVV